MRRQITALDVQLCKQLLQQRDARRYMRFDEVSWIAYRLNCSLDYAERLIEHTKEEQAQS